MPTSDNPSSNSEEQFMIEGDDSNQPPLIVNNKNIDQERHPDLNNIQSVALKQGPRSSKEAKYTTIVNRHTGEVHHHALHIKTSHLKKGEWIEREDKSITLSDEDGNDEIQKLIDFLETTHKNSTTSRDGDYAILTIPTQGLDPNSLQALLGSLSATGRVNALVDILEFSKHDTELFRILVDRISQDPQLFSDAAAALNLATYKNAVDKLISFIDEEALLHKKELRRGRDMVSLNRQTQTESHETAIPHPQLD